MNSDLRRHVHDRLASEDLVSKNWSGLVLAACDGRDALDGALQNTKATTHAAEKTTATTGTGAYLTSLAVEGFRGIGPKQTLTLTAGPGLTIIVGRNGSGKSSFAEALEVLLTGDSKRWSDRSKIWKEGWRNLHQAHPAAIEAELLLVAPPPHGSNRGHDMPSPSTLVPATRRTSTPAGSISRNRLLYVTQDAGGPRTPRRACV